jgi:hypothetical protein
MDYVVEDTLEVSTPTWWAPTLHGGEGLGEDNVEPS